MADINGGIGISNTLFPTFIADNFPVVESNFVKGGIHYIDSKTAGPPGATVPQFFWQIAVNRRLLGMLVYVKDENIYYQLKHRNSGVFDETDPENFTPLEIGGGGSGEWIDSVFGVYNDPDNIPTVQKKDGNRFLVGTSGAGGFLGYSNRVATYVVNGSNLFQGGFEFSLPPDGCTVRVDNDPITIYKFSGTNSTNGMWHKEIQNQIRYIYPTSNNGLTYSFTTTEQTPLVGYGYTNSVYLANFGTANSGSVTLSIDGNPYLPVKKVSSNTLVDLSANDFDSDVLYQLAYGGGVFQISLPGSGSGGTIGPPEAGDGTYTDGLFTDFTESTPIGTAIDRFNEILKALVPPSAPNLNSWSVTSGSFVSGNISYTNAQAPGLNYEVVQSVNGNVTQGGAFNPGVPNKYRLGITNATGTIGGDINSDVAASTQSPVKAYESKAIGNGITGSIALYFNSSTASIVDLGSSLGQITLTTEHGRLTVTSATSSKFATGAPFENSWWRTGTWEIYKTSGFAKNGYNQVELRHLLPSNSITLSYYEFLIDAETAATTLTPDTLSYQLSAPRFLSGIQYYTAGKITYRATANNIYRNTYYAGADAGVFTDSSTVLQSKSPIYNGQTYDTNYTSYSAFTPNPSQQALSAPVPNLLPSQQSFVFETDFEVKSGVRKINGGATFRMTAKRTLQTSSATGEITASNLFIDNDLTASTDLEETFNTETKRKPNSVFHTVVSVDSAAWDPSSSLLDVNTNALQVSDGRLLYPSFDFKTPGSLSVNPNFNINNRDYSTCKSLVTNTIHGQNVDGNRTYTRLFNFGSTSYPKFTFDISFVNTNWVNVGSGLGGNNCYLEIKLPHKAGTTPDGGLLPSGSVTGWQDATRSWLPVTPLDGTGCLSGSVPSNGTGWAINFGIKKTFDSGGYVLMRITSGRDWKGYVEKITIYPGR
jgi:hypothetical protein